MKQALLAALFLCGALLVARACFGPGRYLVPVHSPMNLEGVFALLFLAALIAAAPPFPGSFRKMAVFRGEAFWLLAIVTAAFVRYLDFPLLADDYSHIWNARHADWRALAAHFTVPEADRFYRPVGYLSYAFDARWAGLAPAAWRAGNLALHLLDTLLVFRLCLDLQFSRFGAFAGALIFGVHGSRPEAVTWVAARFDLLAVLFALACVLTVLRGAGWAVSGLLFAAAVFSKESAYVVPVVLAAILYWQGLDWRGILSRVGHLLALAAIALAYRLYLLKGIGGYTNAANGSPTIWNFGFASSLKALFLRFWGAMLFPLNWTGEPGAGTAIALALALAALVFFAWRGAARRGVLLGIAIATICSLPVHQFLSIGPDLEKSRVLYLASVGLAIVFASLLDTQDRLAIAAFTCVAVFQVAALESNLAVWKRVGTLAGATCLAAAEAAPMAVEDLPNVVDGVYFLHTGFPECVLLQRPELLGKVLARRRAGVPLYKWDGVSRTLQRSE